MKLREPPPGWVDLARLEGVRLSIGYHRADNFTCAPLPGYGAPGAWLVAPVAARLEAVLDDLAAEGLGLVIYDAYRPVRASLRMVRYCEAHGRASLLDGWVAPRSRHNHGVAVDVGLTQRASGRALPMGTAWDAFEAGSQVANATGPARVHRRRLADAMTARGFVPYAREWWHFELPLEPRPPALDVPYGADEPGGLHGALDD